MTDDSSSSTAPGLQVQEYIQEARHSLPQILAELKLEQRAGSFAMEKLSQSEIGKLIANKRKRRVKKA